MFQYITLPTDSPCQDAICRINGLLDVASFLKYQSINGGVEFYQSSMHQIPWKGDLMSSVTEQARHFHQEMTQNNSIYKRTYAHNKGQWLNEIELQKMGPDYFVKNLPLELFHEHSFPATFSKGGKGRENLLDGEPFQITTTADDRQRCMEWLSEICRRVWQLVRTELISGREYETYVSRSRLSFCDACDLGGETLIHCGEDIFVFYNGLGD